MASVYIHIEHLAPCVHTMLYLQLLC